MANRSTTSSYLPLEIIFNILLRLPAKALIRFMCVCRAWDAIIHDETFIKAHHDLMKTNSRRALVLVPLGPWSSASISIDGDVFGSAVRIQRPVQQSTRIVSCCNGLVCIQVYNVLTMLQNYAVWNPSIQKSKRIPYTLVDPPAQLKLAGCFTYLTYGFGYDSTNDDYKFLRAAVLDDFNYQLHSEVKIYSLKSKAWKKIQNLPCIRLSGLHSRFLSFVSGALHWLMDHDLILTIDLTTEKYDYFQVPEVVDTYPSNLEVLDGFLCVYFRGDMQHQQY